MVEIISGGSIINGANPVYFIKNTFFFSCVVSLHWWIDKDLSIILGSLPNKVGNEKVLYETINPVTAHSNMVKASIFQECFFCIYFFLSGLNISANFVDQKAPQ